MLEYAMHSDGIYFYEGKSFRFFLLMTYY